MRILIAEDDPTSRLLLDRWLTKWGHEVVVTENGQEAHQVLAAEDAPNLAILDWDMPIEDGVEVCRWARTMPHLRRLYVIILTAKDGEDDIVQGLSSGANDYVTKPPNPRELQARGDVGIRVVELQNELAQRIVDLEASIAREKTLQGLLPICSYCKKVRDDGDYWQQVEFYIEKHADVSFSHGICPTCFKDVVEPELAEFEAKANKEGEDDSGS